jgi:hypothetical protein
MLAEIFMLGLEADMRSLKALTPRGSDARFELPVSSAADDPPRPATAGLGPTLADDSASHG